MNRIPSEYFSEFFEGFCTLKPPGKEGLFQGVANEIHNLQSTSENVL